MLDSGAWLLGSGWARSGSQAMRSSTQGLSLKEAQELGWSHQWLAGFICLIFSECSMWAGTEPSRLPCDIPCVPGVKDLGPFLPSCPGSQDAHIYVVSPTLEEGGSGSHSHLLWTVSGFPKLASPALIRTESGHL